MLISIVIPAYGQNDLLNKCVRAIRESAYGDYEIVVVDDFSHPAICLEDQDTKLVVSKNNIGPAGARNLGVSHTKGDVILFVDSDVVVAKDAYGKIRQIFEDSNVDAVQGMYALDFPRSNFFSDYKNLYWNFNQMILDQSVYSVCTAIFSIKRRVFEEVGGFNSTSLVGEDKEIGLRLERKKKKIIRNKQVKGVHYKKFTFLELIKHHFQNSVASALLLLKMKKNRPLQGKEAWAGKPQIVGIFLSPIIIFLFLSAFFTFNPVFLFLAAIVLAGFLCTTAGFLRYCYKRFGLKFSFFTFFMCILESSVAAAGIGMAIIRFFFLGRKDLNFRMESKLYESAR